jgi:hypothetical protein
MKMTRFKLMNLLLASMLPVALACATPERAEPGDPDDTAPKTTEKEVAGVDEPGDLNPVEAQTMVDDVTIGKMAGADGMIAIENQTDDFAPGQPLVLSMNVSDATAGSAVKVAVFGPGEAKVGEQEKPIAAGAKYLTFDIATTGWGKGDYRAEVWMGDEKVNTQQFQIVDSENAG